MNDTPPTARAVVIVPAVAVDGDTALLVQVRAELGAGPASFTVSGQPDSWLVRDRLRAAVVNSGLTWPMRPVSLHVTPTLPAADSGLDAAFAVALLAVAGQLPVPDDTVVAGELGLDGTLRPARAVATRAAAVAAAGYGQLLVPTADLPVAAETRGLRARAAATLAELVDDLTPRTWPDPDRVRAARAALSYFVEPGSRQLADLIATEGPIGALDAVLADAVPGLALRSGFTDRRTVTLRAEAARMLEAATRAGLRVVIPEDDEWPTQLRVAIAPPDAPAVPVCLWVRGSGNLGDLLDRSVAVVGSRAATEYGIHVARQLGDDLAAAGWTVVSTGGYGIDTAALRGALTTGDGRTVGVVPAGLGWTYPAGSKQLFGDITVSGLLVSAYPPDTVPARHRALTNSVLLAGLTRGAVLVEASTRSGATVVLRHTLALGRPAMAVPGPVTSATSAGTHQVLRQQPSARLVTNAADVLADLDPPAAS